MICVEVGAEPAKRGWIWRDRGFIYSMNWVKYSQQDWSEGSWRKDENITTMRSRHHDGKVLIVLLYVKDLLIFGSDPIQIDQFTNQLFDKFRMNEERDCTNLLAYETHRSISFNQNQVNFKRTPRANTPLEAGTIFPKVEPTPESVEIMKNNRTEVW